jgi:hypothetical protein
MGISHKNQRATGAREGFVKDLLVIGLVIGGWFLLQAYILPKLGIAT